MKKNYTRSIVLLLFMFLLTYSYKAQAVVCSTDTLAYVFNKSSAFRAITLGASSANAIGQYYRAPQTLSIRGFEFYGWASGVPTITLTCEVYLAAADSSPSGAPLASTTITIDSSTTANYNAVTFSSPAVVSSNYLLVISNPSPTNNASIICNDYVARDGAGEFLAMGRILTSWLRSDEIVVGGITFDADWIVEPFVVYENNDSVYVADTTVCAGTALTFNGYTLSPIRNDNMYNVNAFIGAIPTNTSGWTFGDTSTTRYNTASISHTYYIPGTYTATYYDTIRRWAAARCIATRTVRITVLPSVFTSSFTNSSGSLTVNFTNTSTSGLNYNWTFGDLGTSTSISPTHVYALPGRYQVCVSSYNRCDTVTQCDSITVTCPPPAAPGTISGPASVCPGDVDTFSIAAVSGATSYTWTLPSGWTGSSTSTQIITTAGSTMGSISVTANSICGSSAATTHTVTLGPPPPAPSSISGRTTFCPGDTILYSVSPVSGAISYTWTLPSGWSGTSTSNSISVIAGSAGGAISVTANNACGSSTAASSTISLGSAPATPGSISGSATFCSGLTYTYSVAAVSGASSYTWSAPSGWTGTSSTNSITYTASSSAGTISVTANNTCGSSAASTLVVNVGAGPAAPGAITGAPSVLCPGSSYTLNVSPVSGASSYTWSIPASWSGSSTSNSITITVDTMPGSVSVAAVNSCGTGSSSTMSYTIGAAPIAPGSISGPTSVCANTTVVFSIAPVSGASSYLWTLPSGWTGTSSSNSISATTSSTSGTVSVSSVNACGSSGATTLSVSITALSVLFNTTPQSQNPPNGTITASAPSGGSGPYQFALNAGPFQPTGNFSNVPAGTHQVVVQDLNGCTQIFTVVVSSTVSVNDLTQELSFVSYPNPANDVLTISVVSNSNINAQLVLTDIVGKVLMQTGFNDVKEIKELWHVGHLARGTYFLQLVQDEKIQTRKITIQ